ncbi:hypothetical protein NM688_g529 [Phlebia brevispora]|uniref:Uncharacterized protein n=1 Tax=Phlebia brevispora TaxID=194682 RepID=A0ACC1TDT1_9APHY|nr:hypothetical protein NM688_g529 [Phlebia brevispora]
MKFGEQAGCVIEAPKDAQPQYSNTSYQSLLGAASTDNPWSPFQSKLDWEVEKWAKLRGPGDTSFSELLAIEGVRESLNLSFRNAKELNSIIDDMLPKRPAFCCDEVSVAGMIFDIYFRDVLECARALYGDPEFAPYLVFVPERHYLDRDETVRLYHDMHTGKWWWSTQKSRKYILARPSFQSSSPPIKCNKTAYPIYMTIGSLSKDIRRKPSRHGQILLGYLPTIKLEHIKDPSERRRALADLFHQCMRKILKPLQKARVTGIPMASGDGVWRRCHPIFAAYIGDYPEQTLVTLVKYGGCPTCPIPIEELGSGKTLPPRDLEPIQAALAKFRCGIGTFEEACHDAGIKAVAHPFWEDLPYVHIYRSITPDILHQLYQGVIKHLVAWLQDAFGTEEIDARCTRMPPNRHVRIFKKGISTLSRVSGEEHRDIYRLLLGLIVDLRLPGGASSARLVRAVRAMLDFLYLAQYPVHSDETLQSMDEALQTFHENKQVFIDLGIREDFVLPKLHNVGHYSYYIQLYGTTDNYSTEYTERLHIDYTKDAYRASNKKDEFRQMAIWLERKEKIHRHDQYIKWRLRKNAPAPCIHLPHVTLPLHPSVRSLVPFDTLANKYGAYDIRNALASFIAKTINPSLTGLRLERAAAKEWLPLQSVPVYHKVTFANPDPFVRTNDVSDDLDIVDARPAHLGRHRGQSVPGKFNTVLVDMGRGGSTGLRGASYVGGLGWQLTDCDRLEGYRAAQVRVVFKLKHDITRAYRNQSAGICDAAVIPLARIKRSLYLFPVFGPEAPHFLPPVDYTRFPRKDISKPPPEENAYNAWSAKATVVSTGPEATLGPLAGRKVILKDNVCLAGVPCEFGTAVFSDWIPTMDATVVTRILEAGGTIIGKGTCENFCAYGVSNTAASGPVGNPFDKTRSAGGSTSGVAVLIVQGDADLGIGGDQGGSIRIPASHCGIVGLKPTFGLVPYTGIISSETSIDHTGPMSRDVFSNAELLKVIAGVDGMDDRQIAGTPFPGQVPDYPVLLSAARSAKALLSVGENRSGLTPGNTRKLRIGILKEGETSHVMDLRVVACVRTAAKRFEALGAEVVEVSVPGHTQAPLIGRAYRLTQSNNLLGRSSGTRQVYLNDLTDKIMPWTQDKFEKLFSNSSSSLIQGLFADQYYPSLHGKAHNLIRRLRLDYDNIFKDVDILLMPTLPYVAKKLLPQDAPPLTHFEAQWGLTFNTFPFNLTGHPALSVPCGMLSPPEGPEDLKLPVGMQLVGRYLDELALYKAALAWEEANNWKTL